jgi:hypothetical protein
MSYKINVLDTAKRSDGDFTASGVFWLTAPSNKVMPQPGFKSQVANIDDATLLALQKGLLVEQAFISGLFTGNTPLADVQVALQSQLAAAQAALDAYDPPVSGLVGSAFDGSAWSTPEPFSPVIPQLSPVISVQGVLATADHRLPTSSIKPVAPKVTRISPNWCDKTTWYTGSLEVTDEVAVDSGDHTTYTVSHQNVIDAYHGKITFEDYLKDDYGRSYRVTVKVNDVVKTEQDPYYGYGGDYTVDYADGSITFLAALQPTDVVKATYHYAARATFIIKPSDGKRLLIGAVEVQFSEDAIINDSFVFQAYGLVDVFAPQLMSAPYSIPSGTKIPIGDPLVYKTFNDFLNDSNGAYPGYPAFGGSNWRALKKAAYIFVWEYAVGLTALDATLGMEIHVDLEHDAQCDGAFATATCYCTEEAI